MPMRFASAARLLIVDGERGLSSSRRASVEVSLRRFSSWIPMDEHVHRHERTIIQPFAFHHQASHSYHQVIQIIKSFESSSHSDHQVTRIIKQVIPIIKSFESSSHSNHQVI
jgi:cytochrome P450